MEKARLRQQVLLDHLRPALHTGASDLLSSPCAAGDSAPYERTTDFSDDVVIVSALRTPICKAKRGSFKDTFPDDLLAPVLKAVIEQTGVRPEEVGDIVVGSVLAPGAQRANECRMAAFFAGFPGIGAGLESMSVNPMAWEGSVNPRVESNQRAQDCLLPMGVTSENVAERYGVTRRTQDEAAVRSHAKAAAATKAGRFKDEIVPVHTKIVDPKTGDEKQIVVSVDDGIRGGTSLADLAKLKTVFKKDGTTTAGNSSQVSDGAGAVLLMKRSEAVRRGLPILGVFRSFVAVGVDPAVMGVGPAVAIPAACKAAGLDVSDIDLFEINEAFASQFTYCAQKLELDQEKINVNGGALALGHPLGATGARCVATLLHEMKKRGKDCRFGIVTMCIGSGMGAAMVLERGSVVDPPTNAGPIREQSQLSRYAK
eukprot:jgi/Mesen1/1674/ME000137S00587